MNHNRTFWAILLRLLRRLLRIASGKSAGVQIKLPAMYDISHWIINIAWADIYPVPIIMLTKGTESNNYRDPTFVEYFAAMRDIVHCRRGVYHFFRRAADPVSQANYFIDYIQSSITDADVLCLDFEEGGETASQLWAFLNRVRQRRPNNLVIIYSRKNLFDPIVMTTAEKNFFKTFPTWPAGYPTDPDGINTIPVGYIPDQTKWGAPWAWQYSDDGIVHGFEGNNVDLNNVEQPFRDWLHYSPVPVPPSSDVVTAPYIGVTRTVGRRFNSDVYVTELDTAKVTFEVAHELPFDNGLFLVSQVCQAKAAAFGWNGDEWDRNTPLPAYPKNAAWSKGVRYKARVSAEPSLNVRANGQAEIVHVVGNEYNESTGRRYLIQNGIIQSYLSGTEPQYTERHPRGLAGLSVDGKRVIMVTVDGRSSISAGVTLKEGAQILAQFGAYTAYDRGGGGDAIDVMGGVVQNVPSDVNTAGVPGVERANVQAILAYAEKESTMTNRYTATALNDGTRIRYTHDTTGGYPNSYVRGTTFQGDDMGDVPPDELDGLFTAPRDLSNANGIYQRAGDQWLRVLTVNNLPPKTSNNNPITQTIYVAVKHLGNPVCSIVDNGTNEPPPVTEKTIVKGTLYFNDNTTQDLFPAPTGRAEK